MARTKFSSSTMSDSSSPTKRRKTKGSFEMKAKQGIPPPSIITNYSHLMDEGQVPWPPDLLPVEIFELIIAYLPRSSIQNMRCVNKEFENKVSAYLFKVVVVPFKPEIYGITPEPILAGITDAQTRANEILQGSVMLQDKGMRVFQGFGRHIRKFAMSFEFDEKKLANPPIKSDQEAIKAFWGIYRWPFKKYNRYAQLEGLEQTADETRTMAKALRFIGDAKELGLSIDGGLGWLAGPDINQRVVERGGKVVVFGESKFVPEEKEKVTKGKLSKLTSSTSSGNFGEGQHAQFQRMLQESGLNGPSLEAGVQMMIETEDTTGYIGQWHDDLLLPGLSSASSSFTTENLGSAAGPPQLTLTPLPNNPFTGHYTLLEGNASPLVQFDSDEEDLDLDVQPAIAASKLVKAKTEGCSLKPNDLTNAQREMLLEIEWAQRAFMQSYAIAIIDNPLTFNNIETLTIARIPNRHLPILRREDFWDGLPQLNKLSLAVIPDWRDVVKLPTSWVQDVKLAPSQSVNGVFQILQDQISRRMNIKTLHFEWICGGEEAPGLFARNQHILAAPLVSKAMDMVNRSYFPRLLSLPHVEHLSLKNCWISPHILTRLGLTVKKKTLHSLTLDSVSLTASLAQNAQPNPLTGHAANNHAHHAAANNLLLNFQQLAGQNGPQAHIAGLPGPPANNNITPPWLEPPRAGSWAAVIETLTPGQTLAQIRHARQIDSHEPEARDPGSITKLEFKSCGYVRLPLDFDQTALDPPALPAPQASTIAKRISDLDSFMMKPHDYTLGLIVNHISDIETQTLENAWNMSVGWGQSRSVLLLESLADGVANAGHGRFDGVIWEPRQPASDSSS